MSEKEKRPIRWWRMWPVIGFVGLALFEIYAANDMQRPIDWAWVGFAIAGAVAVIILRVGFRI
ncbi:MAG: hypothetical protein H6839_11800 [Planctomycetes bacterium]|nr:hypothetical protein [Planctomycetota bacterium]